MITWKALTALVTRTSETSGFKRTVKSHSWYSAMSNSTCAHADASEYTTSRKLVGSWHIIQVHQLSVNIYQASRSRMYQYHWYHSISISPVMAATSPTYSKDIHRSASTRRNGNDRYPKSSRKGLHTWWPLMITYGVHLYIYIVHYSPISCISENQNLPWKKS